MLLINKKNVLPSEDQVKQMIKLMTQCMREDKNHAPTEYLVDEEYPNVFRKENYANLWAILDGTKVVSALAAYPMSVNLSNGIFKMVGIGSVSTHIDYRGKGLSSELHTRAIEYYSTVAKIDMAILWTNLFDYYRKFDYELVGREYVVAIDKEIPPIDTALEIVPYKDEFFDDIFDLYSQNSNCVKRTKDEFKRSLAIPNMDILCSIAEGVVIGYTIRGKGSDLKATVHEWYAPKSALIELLNENLRREKSSIYVLSPAKEIWQSDPFINNVLLHEGSLGMIKILDPTGFVQKLGIKNLSAKRVKQDLIQIEFENNITEVSASVFIKTVFGPESPSSLLGENFKELRDWFPQNLFVWGLDSV